MKEFYIVMSAPEVGSNRIMRGECLVRTSLAEAKEKALARAEKARKSFVVMQLVAAFGPSEPPVIELPIEKIEE